MRGIASVLSDRVALKGCRAFSSLAVESFSQEATTILLPSYYECRLVDSISAGLADSEVFGCSESIGDPDDEVLKVLLFKEGVVKESHYLVFELS